MDRNGGWNPVMWPLAGRFGYLSRLAAGPAPPAGRGEASGSRSAGRRLAGTQPGRISWTGGFSVRMVPYLAIALLTVFASFFPEVGSSITQWLEPVRKVLP